MTIKLEPRDEAVIAVMASTHAAHLVWKKFADKQQDLQQCEAIVELIHDLRGCYLEARQRSNDLEEFRAVAERTCAFDDALSLSQIVFFSVLHAFDSSTWQRWIDSGVVGLPEVAISAEAIWTNWARLHKSVGLTVKGLDPRSVAESVRRMQVEYAKVQVAVTPKYSRLRPAKFWCEAFGISQDTLARRIESGAIHVSADSTKRQIRILNTDWPPNYID